MNWFVCEVLSHDETTWIRLVIWIILDDFTMHHGKIYFVECKLIINSLLIRMVCDSDSAISNCVDEVFDIYLRLPIRAERPSS